MVRSITQAVSSARRPAPAGRARRGRHGSRSWLGPGAGAEQAGGPAAAAGMGHTINEDEIARVRKMLTEV
jgi:hypothetical protein